MKYPQITVRVLSPELALSLAYSHIEATLPDGSVMNINSRNTDVWKKFDGQWKAIHEHSFVPVDIAKGIADLHHPM